MDNVISIGEIGHHTTHSRRVIVLVKDSKNCHGGLATQDGIEHCVGKAGSSKIDCGTNEDPCTDLCLKGPTQAYISLMLLKDVKSEKLRTLKPQILRAREH